MRRTEIVVPPFDHVGVHPPHIRDRALKLRAEGVPFGDICRRLGLSRNTVSDWLHGERARHRAGRPRCPRCDSPPRAPDDQGAYAYLLGRYLGDRHLVTTAKVPVLRIFFSGVWPGLIDECEAAMLKVVARTVQRVPKPGLPQRPQLLQALAVPALPARRWTQTRAPDPARRLAATDH